MHRRSLIDEPPLEQVIKDYDAQGPDEMSVRVGDCVDISNRGRLRSGVENCSYNTYG